MADNLELIKIIPIPQLPQDFFQDKFRFDKMVFQLVYLTTEIHACRMLR